MWKRLCIKQNKDCATFQEDRNPTREAKITRAVIGATCLGTATPPDGHFFRLKDYRSVTIIKYRLWFPEKRTFSGKFCARQWPRRESIQINGLIHRRKADVVVWTAAVTSQPLFVRRNTQLFNTPIKCNLKTYWVCYYYYYYDYYWCNNFLKLTHHDDGMNSTCWRNDSH